MNNLKKFKKILAEFLGLYFLLPSRTTSLLELVADTAKDTINTTTGARRVKQTLRDGTLAFFGITGVVRTWLFGCRLLRLVVRERTSFDIVVQEVVGRTKESARNTVFGRHLFDIVVHLLDSLEFARGECESDYTCYVRRGH